MDEELRVYLAAFETRLSEQIVQVEIRLDGRIDRLTQRIDQVEAKLSERIENVETNLLTEFHKWASPVEMRQRTHAAAIRAVDAEMEALADRVTNLEGRKS